jgi:hypothetical protein
MEIPSVVTETKGGGSRGSKYYKSLYNEW